MNLAAISISLLFLGVVAEAFNGSQQKKATLDACKRLCFSNKGKFPLFHPNINPTRKQWCEKYCKPIIGNLPVKTRLEKNIKKRAWMNFEEIDGQNKKGGFVKRVAQGEEIDRLKNGGVFVKKFERDEEINTQKRGGSFVQGRKTEPLIKEDGFERRFGRKEETDLPEQEDRYEMSLGNSGNGNKRHFKRQLRGNPGRGRGGGGVANTFRNMMGDTCVLKKLLCDCMTAQDCPGEEDPDPRGRMEEYYDIRNGYIFDEEEGNYADVVPPAIIAGRMDENYPELYYGNEGPADPRSRQRGQQPGQIFPQQGQRGQQPGQIFRQQGQRGQQQGQRGQQPGQIFPQQGQRGQQPGQIFRQQGQRGQQQGQRGQQPGQIFRQQGQRGQQPGRINQQNPQGNFRNSNPDGFRGIEGDIDPYGIERMIYSEETRGYGVDGDEDRWMNQPFNQQGGNFQDRNSAGVTETPCSILAKRANLEKRTGENLPEGMNQQYYQQEGNFQNRNPVAFRVKQQDLEKTMEPEELVKTIEIQPEEKPENKKTADTKKNEKPDTAAMQELVNFMSAILKNVKSDIPEKKSERVIRETPTYERGVIPNLENSEETHYMPKVKRDQRKTIADAEQRQTKKKDVSPKEKKEVHPKEKRDVKHHHEEKKDVQHHKENKDMYYKKK